MNNMKEVFDITDPKYLAKVDKALQEEANEKFPDEDHSHPPGLPAPIFMEDLFTMSYRNGNNILSLIFRFPNKEGIDSAEYLRKAIGRAKLHCDKMRYRFLFCRPWITDLDSEEKRMDF